MKSCILNCTLTRTMLQRTQLTSDGFVGSVREANYYTSKGNLKWEEHELLVLSTLWKHGTLCVFFQKYLHLNLVIITETMVVWWEKLFQYLNATKNTVRYRTEFMNAILWKYEFVNASKNNFNLVYLLGSKFRLILNCQN